MDRKDRILAYMRSKEYIPLKFGELMTVLDVPDEAGPELLEILTELSDDGKIYVTKKGRYISVDGEANTVAGKLRCNAKGYFGFVICDDEGSSDVFIPGDKLGYALDGDRVLVRIDEINSKTKHREGHVLKILERFNKIIVGVIYKEKDSTFRVRPDKRQFYSKIRIKPEDMMGAEIGSRVAVEITEYTDNGKVYGRVMSVLGDEYSLKSCIEGIIISNGISRDFDDAVKAEADRIPDAVDDIADRVDLRDKLIFTIDGDDARDFDDAVSLTLLENGNYYLGVHIADVSHYVKEGSALDNEAYNRGTSVYLADRVIPMLPQRLSNGICSLNPSVDRLTLSVFMEINSSGEVVSHKLEKSVICSKERMTYNKVTTLLEGNDKELEDRYGYMMPTLNLMRDLEIILEKRRSDRGAIQFDFPETGVIVDEDGTPIEIIKEERGISNKIIEQFMLTANETIAEYAFWAELPFVYRIHEAPSSDKITVFNEFIRHFGLMIKGKFDDETPVHPKALQTILDKISGKPEERMIATEMLHSLMKAEYNASNAGHFGLAAKYYCHFTSPIRRYPDLVIHRILKDFISGTLDDVKKAHYEGFVRDAAKHSSECEITAEHSEREVDDLMKTAYISSYIGAEFEGVVSSVTSFGMFVEIENAIEGLVRLENMNDDYYEYDEVQSMLIGKRHNKLYRIGDRVKIVVAHTDLFSRQIDFVRVEDATKKVLRSFEKKTSLLKRSRSKSFKDSGRNKSTKKFVKKKKKK